MSHELESYSNKPEIINALPLNSKILGGLLLRFFFVQYNIEHHIMMNKFLNFENHKLPYSF